MRLLPKWKCVVCTLLLLGFTIDVFGAIGMVREARNEDLSPYNSSYELLENAKVSYRELVESLRQSSYEMQNNFSHVPLDSDLTWYEVLGVDSNASVEDIQRAFRRLARLGHSDRGGDDTIFKAVNIARQEGIVRARSEIKVYETTFLFGFTGGERLVPHVRLADILPQNLKKPFEEIDKLLRQCKLFYISEGIILAALLGAKIIISKYLKNEKNKDSWFRRNKLVRKIGEMYAQLKQNHPEAVLRTQLFSGGAFLISLAAFPLTKFRSLFRLAKQSGQYWEDQHNFTMKSIKVFYKKILDHTDVEHFGNTTHYTHYYRRGETLGYMHTEDVEQQFRLLKQAGCWDSLAILSSSIIGFIGLMLVITAVVPENNAQSKKKSYPA